MRFTFRTEAVLTGLNTLKSFRGTVEDLDHLVSLAGAATIALDLWPETSVFLRAANLGVADPQKTLEIFRRKADDTARRFAEFFPPGARHPVSDLKKAYFDPKTRPSSFCDLVLCVGDPSTAAEEPPPMILGGLFVFRDGHWAEIEWDSRLMEAESLLPLRIPYLDPRPDIGNRLSLMEAPSHWGEVLAYQAILQEGASILVDPQNRLLRTEVKCPGQGQYTEVETRTAYLPQGARRQDGFQFQWSSSNGYLMDRWSVTESGGRENRLDPRVTQFFLLPGTVWEVTGHPHAIQELDPVVISQRIQGGRDYLQTHDKGKNQGVRMTVFPKGVEERWLITFGGTNEEGIPLLWQLRTEEQPSVKRIDAISVTPENRDDVERYIRRKADKARGLNRVPT